MQHSIKTVFCEETDMNETFGIEGSYMAIFVNALACVVAVVIGRYIRKRKEQ